MTLIASGRSDAGTRRYHFYSRFDEGGDGSRRLGSLSIVHEPANFDAEWRLRHFTIGQSVAGDRSDIIGGTGIHGILVLCFTCSMIQADLFPIDKGEPVSGTSKTKVTAPSDMPSVIERLATLSSRPRYAFMVLNLIARAAGESGEAGPYVVEEGKAVRLRDWLCDALSPMAQRDPRRIALMGRVRGELEEQGALPRDAKSAADAVELAVRLRVRASGRCNVSRAVSELVRAGLIRRHYQGWRVDHQNRGARREAVYTLTPEALSSLRNCC